MKLCGVILFLALSLPSSHDLVLSNNDTCPVWQSRSNTAGQCVCLKDIFHGIINCIDDPYNLLLQKCFCVTSSHVGDIRVGSCQYTCTRGLDHGWMSFFSVVTNTSNVTEVVCGPHKRQGQMCGSCMDGYAPPVYSYSLSCVNCTTSNWAKYTAVSLLPVTAFFIFVITFRLSVTSPLLHGFIICIQILLSPPNMRLLHDHVMFTKTRREHKLYIEKILTIPMGIWNLDFFRLVYTPFCLHPHSDTLQVLALDYIIAVYPLLLIALSYLLVLLYARNVRFIVCLWKPFVPLFIRFRRQWNIRSSLVDAFATFLLLSYVKILSVSVDLLMPVVLYDQNGHTLPQLYLFNQGDVAFLGSQHLPYACLALFFLFTFTLMPMLLLFLYPCSCFQVCLNRTGCSCQPLHTFMDTFQGHYKNGTNGTRDLRFFSGLYLLLRIVAYISFMFAYQVNSYAYTTVILLLITVSTALVQPYKNYLHNITETYFLATLTVASVTLLPLGIDNVLFREQALTLVNIIVCLPVLTYIPTLLWLKCWRCISPSCNTVIHKLKRAGRNNYERLQSI